MSWKVQTWLRFGKPALALLALLAVLGASCQSRGPKFDIRGARPANFITANATNQLPSDCLRPSTEPFRLGPGDRIEIEILDLTGTRTTTFVCPDGKIYYDLLPGLDVWNLTLEETRQLLARELSAYYQHPQVAVTLRDVQSKRVWVLGRLNRSGVFPLAQPMTVLEAISQAGGLFTSRFGGTTEELADLNHSFLIRRGELMPVNFQKLLREGDTSQNIYLQPDDFLYLPSALSQEVHILGAVNSPRPLGYVDNMTLASAMAKALGPQPAAYLTHVAIVRGSLTNPRIAVVNFKAIMLGQVPDVRLEPRDIVYVPLAPYRTLEKYAHMITDTFVRTVAANEGGHAAGHDNFSIGVSNPIQ